MHLAKSVLKMLQIKAPAPEHQYWLAHLQLSRALPSRALAYRTPVELELKRHRSRPERQRLLRTTKTAMANKAASWGV